MGRPRSEGTNLPSESQNWLQGNQPSVVFICGLFNDALSSSRYVASDSWIINKQLIGKNVAGSGRGLIVYTLPVFGWKDRRK